MDTERQTHATHNVIIDFKHKMDGDLIKEVTVLHDNGPFTCGMPDSCLLEFLLDNGHHGRLPTAGEYAAYVDEVIMTSEYGDYVILNIDWENR